MQVVKTILYALLFTTLIVAAIALFAWTYGSPVPRNLSFVKITSSSAGSHINVHIDGGIMSSSLAVSSVKQHREGHCIIVVVRQGLARRGRRAGDFHLDIAVPDDVDEIAFENSHNVIWHR
jgi:hypothetical protein